MFSKEEFMSKVKLTTVDFTGTKQQEKELREKLAEIKNMDGNLMPALQAAQGIYGYLPIEVQKIVSEELNVPLEEIFGVSTFYSQRDNLEQQSFIWCRCQCPKWHSKYQSRRRHRL